MKFAVRFGAGSGKTDSFVAGHGGRRYPSKSAVRLRGIKVVPRRGSSSFLEGEPPFFVGIVNALCGRYCIFAFRALSSLLTRKKKTVPRRRISEGRRNFVVYKNRKKGKGPF